MAGPVSRRAILRGATLTAIGTSVARPVRAESATDEPPRAASSSAVAIASANGLRTVSKAYNLTVRRRYRPASAAVQGVALVEADPNDVTVGYGGLPNEAGVVQLDAACMDGPTHNAGSVAAIEDIMHPAQVAELVMDRTDHVHLVGPGARQFAIDHGFPPVNLLTDRARQRWLAWRAQRRNDDRLAPLTDDPSAETDHRAPTRPWGTIHCSVVSPQGDVGCCTTTSGLAFKIPGRIGDSPLIGAGLYCDNEVGSAGATGRGEAAILGGAGWLVIERMRQGASPVQACVYTLRRIAEQSRRAASWQPALWDVDRPAYSLTLYAVRKDGSYGAATMRGRPGETKFAICDHRGARLEAATVVFPTA
ncbi:MAG: asparaginase [Myxococcales bacterium FL481]|nr:MAG: asparaginase [Myxococcales bacterium FL481]